MKSLIQYLKKFLLKQAKHQLNIMGQIQLSFDHLIIRGAINEVYDTTNQRSQNKIYIYMHVYIKKHETILYSRKCHNILR